jgi:hypothetical protein
MNTILKLHKRSLEEGTVFELKQLQQPLACTPQNPEEFHIAMKGSSRKLAQKSISRTQI